MIHKYIKVEEGSYRGQDMSGRIFPILKDYQTFAGDKKVASSPLIAVNWMDSKAWTRPGSMWQT
jgi:hypothetical protein